MSVDATLYRQAISNFATGVTVITTSVDGRPAGMTASAVTSLSLEPVQLLVCIASRLPTHEAIITRGRFGKLAYTVLRDTVFAHPTLAESLNNLFNHFQD